MTFYGRNLREDLNVRFTVNSSCNRGHTKCSYKNCNSCNNFVNETTYINYTTVALLEKNAKNKKRHFMHLEEHYSCRILY